MRSLMSVQILPPLLREDPHERILFFLSERAGMPAEAVLIARHASISPSWVELATATRVAACMPPLSWICIGS